MNPLIPQDRSTEIDSEWFSELEHLSSTSSEPNANGRIQELFEQHSDSLVSDLLAHPEHRKNYRKIGANLRQNDSLNTFQSSLGFVQKIARLLENHDMEGLEKVAHQIDADRSSNVRLSSVLLKFPNLKVPQNLEEIRDIPHPSIRAHLMAAIINRDEIKICNLGLTKRELMQMAPHLTYLDAWDAFDDSWSTNEIHSFLDTCINLKRLEINSNKITRLPNLRFCETLVVSGCTQLTELPPLPLCETFILLGCTNLKELPPLPSCEGLRCSDCPGLTYLPALPLCKKLNCSNCMNLDRLPPLPQCEYLECGGCTKLAELPPLPLCETFILLGCTNLKELPPLPSCRGLRCSDCPGLTYLSALPLCTDLNCSNCTNLDELPHLPLCKHLRCEGCTKLAELPPLPQCEKLFCSRCTSLTQLTALPQCKGLDCSGCTSLTQIFSFPMCEMLNCSDCPNLNELPPLPLCKGLDCSSCISLTRLPNLPLCERLFCTCCSNLTELPPLPNCVELHYTDCPSLNLNLIPIQFRPVVHAQPARVSQQATLTVKLQDLNKDPLSVLFDLESAMLGEDTLPRIRFIEPDGHAAESLDLGGVTRVFITRLIQSLISHSGEPKQLGFKKADSGLFMPVIDYTKDVSVQIRGFQVLGAILQLGYESSFGNQPFTTGLVFDRKLFDIITSFSFLELEGIAVTPEKISPDIKLKLMLLMPSEKYIRETLPLLRIPAKNLTTQQFEVLRNVVIGSLDEEEKGPPNLHSSALSESEIQGLKPWVLAKAKEVLLKQKSDIDELLGPCIIAKRMQIMTGTSDGWLRLTTQGTSSLDTRIQGSIDKDAFWKAIQWKTGNRNLDPEKVDKTKGFMKKWIEEATPEKLEALCNFVAGSPTLSPSQTLSFQLYDTPAIRLPTTHSCFLVLDIPINYADDKAFANKLEYALANISSLESSGLEAI